jgi:hypothetical protein
MNSHLNPEEQTLYRAVDEVLHYVWDPIGVSAIPQARDEYHSYLPQVFSLLRSGATESEIAAHLASIASDRMGLTNAQERSNEAASALVDWRESIGG